MKKFKSVYARIHRALRLARKSWAGLFDNGYPTAYPLVRGAFHWHLIRKVLIREGYKPSNEQVESLFKMFGEYEHRWFF